MRIPHGYTDTVQTSNDSAKPVASRTAGSASSGETQSGSSDNVQLSGVSRVLQSGSAQRAARIAHLSSLVQSGKYGVSSEAMSKSLVAETIAQSSFDWKAATQQ